MADYTKTSVKRGGYDRRFYNTPLYRSWSCMKTRCLNKTTPDYSRYGGRGISISKEWLTFEGFLRDMGPSYKKGLSIERIDNNGGYCVDNCRWATKVEQANNTRNIERARKYEFQGEKFTIHQLANLFKIKRTTLDMRLRLYGWPLERALVKIP